MSSILTNVGAMVALQNLQSINKNLATVQNEISTGKSVGTAKDNAAVWAISKVMESDVESFKAISSSLSLGESTVAVARQASETVTDLLTQMKNKIVAAQEENVDRQKIQDDVAALRDQIESVVGAAQFNGLNLLTNQSGETGTDVDPGDELVNVLASLDRSSNGVEASDISVNRQDLTTEAATAGTLDTDVGSGNTATDGGAAAVAFTLTTTPAAGVTYQFNTGGDVDFSDAVFYVAREGDTMQDVVNQMVSRLNFQAESDDLGVTFAATGNAGEVNITNTSGADLDVVAADVQEGDGSNQDGVIGGGLEYLDKIDVTAELDASAALGLIEGLIQSSIDSAAAFGSAQGRIETQMEFVSGLTDALKTGIGTLVDANMEEASARLQALQVQQQLGVQSLSIANQAPQSLLALFR